MNKSTISFQPNSVHVLCLRVLSSIASCSPTRLGTWSLVLGSASARSDTFLFYVNASRFCEAISLLCRSCHQSFAMKPLKLTHNKNTILLERIGNPQFPQGWIPNAIAKTASSWRGLLVFFPVIFSAFVMLILH
jgi:hypothetical protein